MGCHRGPRSAKPFCNGGLSGSAGCGEGFSGWPDIHGLCFTAAFRRIRSSGGGRSGCAGRRAVWCCPRCSSTTRTSNAFPREPLTLPATRRNIQLPPQAAGVSGMRRSTECLTRRRVTSATARMPTSGWFFPAGPLPATVPGTPGQHLASAAAHRSQARWPVAAAGGARV